MRHAVRAADLDHAGAHDLDPAELVRCIRPPDLVAVDHGGVAGGDHLDIDEDAVEVVPGDHVTLHPGIPAAQLQSVPTVPQNLTFDDLYRAQSAHHEHAVEPHVAEDRCLDYDIVRRGRDEHSDRPIFDDQLREVHPVAAYDESGRGSLDAKPGDGDVACFIAQEQGGTVDRCGIDLHAACAAIDRDVARLDRETFGELDRHHLKRHGSSGCDVAEAVTQGTRAVAHSI